MPYSPRGNMKRNIRQAIAHTEKAAEFVLGLREQYNPTEPDYVTVCDAIIGSLVAVEELMQQFHDIV
jgi:hypothetical protein